MKDEKVLNLSIEERAALLAAKRKRAQQHVVIASRYRVAAKLAKEARSHKDQAITVERMNEIVREEFEHVKTQIDMERALFTRYKQDCVKLIKDAEGRRIAFTDTKSGQFIVMPYSRDTKSLENIAARQAHNGHKEIDNAKRTQERIDFVKAGGVDDEQLVLDIEEKAAMKAAEGATA